MRPDEDGDKTSFFKDVQQTADTVVPLLPIG
jgi:hypothetical protein